MERVWVTKFLISATSEDDANDKIDRLIRGTFYAADYATAGDNSMTLVRGTWIGDPSTPAVAVHGRVTAPTVGDASTKFGDMIREVLSLDPAGIISTNTSLARETV